MNIESIYEKILLKLKEYNYMQIDSKDILVLLSNKLDNSRNIEINESYLNELIDKAIKEHITTRLKSGELLDVYQEYIKNNVTTCTKYNLALKNANILVKFFYEFNYYPDPEESLAIINLDTVSNIFSIIYENKKYLIENDKANILFNNDDILISLMEAYCIENNIEIKGLEEEKKDNYDDTSSLDSVSHYLIEINKIPVLSRKEELELAIKCSQGDLSARKKLIEHNLRLAYFVAKKYINKGLEFSDLIQEANLGLMKAIDKFDVSRNLKLSTYATWWIRQNVVRALSDKSRTIRIPVYLREEIAKISSARKILEEKLGRTPTYEEISKETCINVKQIIFCSNISDRVTLKSLDQKLTDNDDDSTIGDFVKDENINIEEEVEVSKMNEELMEIVLNTPKIKPREIEILKCRFGFYGKKYTLQELANKFNITRERVRQIEGRAINKIRSNKNIKKLANYLDDPEKALNMVEKKNKLNKVKNDNVNTVGLKTNNRYTVFDLLPQKYTRDQICQIFTILDDEYAIYLRRFFGCDWDETVDLESLSKTQLDYLRRLINKLKSLLRENYNNPIVLKKIKDAN